MQHPRSLCAAPTPAAHSRIPPVRRAHSPAGRPASESQAPTCHAGSLRLAGAPASAAAASPSPNGSRCSETFRVGEPERNLPAQQGVQRNVQNSCVIASVFRRWPRAVSDRWLCWRAPWLALACGDHRSARVLCLRYPRRVESRTRSTGAMVCCSTAQLITRSLRPTSKSSKCTDGTRSSNRNPT